VEELKTTINFLKTIKNGIVETYQNKTHLDAEELERMMSNETWMTARQAQEKGFVDEVVSVSDAKPFKLQLQNMAVLNCLNSYKNVPIELLSDAEIEENSQSDEDLVSDGDESDTEDTSIQDIEKTPGTNVEGGPELNVENEDYSQPVVVDQGDDAEELQKNLRELRDYLDIFGPRRQI